MAAVFCVLAELAGSFRLRCLVTEVLEVGETTGDVVKVFYCLCNSWRNLEEPRDIEFYLWLFLDPFFILFIFADFLLKTNKFSLYLLGRIC